MSSQAKTIMVSHAEGSHVHNTATAVPSTTKIVSNKRNEPSSPSSSRNSENSKSSTTTQHILQSLPSFQPSPKRIISFFHFFKFPSSSSSTASKTIATGPLSGTEGQLKNPALVGCFVIFLFMGLIGLVNWLLIKTKHRHRVQQRLIQQIHSKEKRHRLEEQDQLRRRHEQLPHIICKLKECYPYEGSKQKRWQALVRWDPHLFPPTHGYHLLKDRQGFHRFVKSANLLPSSKPRLSSPKIRFSSNVAVKFIPRKDEPININAWNQDYHRLVEINSYWQQQQWRLEADGKNKHRRLVVSSIGMRDFRRVVLSTLVDHAQTMHRKWRFRKSVLPFLIDHSHRLRWKWALKRHHAKARFQELILSALPRHHQRLRWKWKTKAFFSRMVLPMLVDHSLRMRFQWALNEADRQLQEMYDYYDEEEQSDEDDDYNVDYDQIDPKYQQHFSRSVVPLLFDHSLRMRFEWAMNEADRQLQEMYDYYDEEEQSDDEDYFDDDAYVDVTDPPSSTRPLKQQRPTGTTPTTTLGGATVWIEGKRRSTRHQPKFGSLYENGIRRSARFL